MAATPDWPGPFHAFSGPVPRSLRRRPVPVVCRVPGRSGCTAGCCGEGKRLSKGRLPGLGAGRLESEGVHGASVPQDDGLAALSASSPSSLAVPWASSPSSLAVPSASSPSSLAVPSASSPSSLAVPWASSPSSLAAIRGRMFWVDDGSSARAPGGRRRTAGRRLSAKTGAAGGRSRRADCRRRDRLDRRGSRHAGVRRGQDAAVNDSRTSAGSRHAA